MRIALITDGIYPYVLGGMQKHSYYLVKYFAKKNVEVSLYHYKNIDGKNPFTEEEKKFITTFEIDYPRIRYFPGHYVRASYLYSLNVLNEIQSKLDSYDFIYSQGFSGWALIERKQMGLKVPPIGVNFHGVEAFQRKATMYNALEALLLKPFIKNIIRKADVTFSLGGKLSSIQKENGAKKIVEIPIGIDHSWMVDKNKLVNHSPVKFLFVGRYERRKGIQELNKAICELLEEYSFEFLFIGPIPLKNQIYNERVKYLGVIRDEAEMKLYIKKNDFLVVPSYSEGMPTVILEAMSCGCAILATDVGAVSEQVSEENGIIFCPGEYETIKEVLIKAINIDSAQLLKMKLNSIEKIQNKFLWNQIINKTLQEIIQIIEEH